METQVVNQGHDTEVEVEPEAGHLLLGALGQQAQHRGEAALTLHQSDGGALPRPTAGLPALHHADVRVEVHQELQHARLLLHAGRQQGHDRHLEPDVLGGGLEAREERLLDGGGGTGEAGEQGDGRGAVH